MAVVTDEMAFNTKGDVQFVDITPDVAESVRNSKLKNGIVIIFVPGSTGAVSTIEYEPGLCKDIPEALERIAPSGLDYAHHQTWHDDNGRSHVRAALIGPSLTVPFVNGQLVNGTWQQIVFIELDTRPRKRTLILQIIGE